MSELSLLDTLQQHIHSSRNGCISYETYMETVLYYQTKGYYQTATTKIGTDGDFYTSSSIHSVYAWVFADYFNEYRLKHNLPFQICEIGGGNGLFAKSLITYIAKVQPEAFQDLTYYFIDVSNQHIEQAKHVLTDYSCVTYYRSLSELNASEGDFNGIIFSNELIDAFPVHVIEKIQGKHIEIMITLDENKNLREVMKPCVNPDIQNWMEWSGIDLTEGQRIEVPLKMLDWITKVAAVMEQGLLVTVDYGYHNDELMDSALHRGSLRGYRKHQLIKDPLLYPGRMDLTTHIHLDSFVKKGEEVGFHTKQVCRQRHFLLAHGLFNHLVDHQNPDPFSKESKRNRAIRSLANPGGISDAFHVIVQEKGIQKDGQ